MGIVNPSLPHDPELVRRAQDGEAAAFGRLVELHAEPLWRCARALCRDDHDAEDLAQETLLQAWRSLGRFDGRGRFSTWLYGILRHRFLKARCMPRPALGGQETAIDRPAREAEPPAAAEQSEEARLVQAAVAALPDEHRAVLELRFFAGASLDEIRDLLYRNTRFHVRIEGQGAKLRSAQLDGQSLPEPVIPAARCDGRPHTVTVRMQEA